jgi:hypothetical protein
LSTDIKVERETVERILAEERRILAELQSIHRNIHLGESNIADNIEKLEARLKTLI